MIDVKVGDIVHVRMKVMDVSHETIYVRDTDGDAFEILKFDIVKVEERGLTVGDEVLYGDDIVKILAIYEDRAWAVFANGVFGIIYINSLRRK